MGRSERRKSNRSKYGIYWYWCEVFSIFTDSPYQTIQLFTIIQVFVTVDGKRRNEWRLYQCCLPGKHWVTIVTGLNSHKTVTLKKGRAKRTVYVTILLKVVPTLHYRERTGKQRRIFLGLWNWNFIEFLNIPATFSLSVKIAEVQDGDGVWGSTFARRTFTPEEVFIQSKDGFYPGTFAGCGR